ncbi:MAG: hypothetical protein WCR69_08470 [Sulfuricurvum sp.]
MERSELYNLDEPKLGRIEEYLGFSLLKLLVFIVAVFLFVLYVGILLYGSNSLDVLLSLQSYEGYLQDEIVKLKSENASLQKEYFELRELSVK